MMEKKSGSNTVLNTPPSPRESEPHGVAVVRIAEREEARYGPRRPGWPSTGTRTPAPARPPPRRSAAKRKCGSSTGTTGARASANSITTVLPLPSMVEWATFAACSARAASSSGTQWPSVLTQREEIAFEVAPAVLVDQVAPCALLDHQGCVAGVGRHLGEPVPDHCGIALDPGPGFGSGIRTGIRTGTRIGTRIAWIGAAHR